MEHSYEIIRRGTIMPFVVIVMLMGFGQTAFSQGEEVVLQDNFDQFTPGDNERYKCSEYWAKWDEKEDGNNIAFLSEYYAGDELGIKVTLTADKYRLKFKFKRKYGDAMNLVCTCNGIGAEDTSKLTIYDAIIEDSQNTDIYYTIETAPFEITTAGDYILYVMLSDTESGSVVCIDDFVVYRGEAEEEQCLAPTNVEANVQGTKVVVTWGRPNQSAALIDEKFEEDVPPANWGAVVNNDYDKTTTWHKFDKVDGFTPAPHSGNSCALVAIDADPQDEWLITPVVANAVYIDFWFWMSKYLLELKKQEGFADHYYVKVSHDGGETWTILWDAVESCMATDDWERVSLNLGATTENTKVAFQALSSESEGIFLNWFIDDITIYDANRNVLSSRGIDSYNVYRGDNKIASNIKRDIYTDLNVPLGIHNYCITANYNSIDCESEKSCVVATVGEVPCNKPTNLHYEVTPDNSKPGTYSVMLYWDEPEDSGRDVYYYKTYVNGFCFGLWIEPQDQSLGQSQVVPGTYRYGVTAVYEQPDCESEVNYIDISVGEDVCLSPDNMLAKVNGNVVVLTWNSRPEVSNYTVYRGEDKMAEEIVETTYTDSNALDGTYDYCVIANYANGCISQYDLYSCATVTIGEPVVYEMPFREEFRSYFKPKDWVVTDFTNPMGGMVWRFNNPGKREIEGAGFDRAFAILDSDYYGAGSVQKSGLITPNIQCSGMTSIQLSFDMQYAGIGDGTTSLSDSYLYFSTDGGLKWTQIEKLEQEIIPNPEQELSPAITKTYTFEEEIKGCNSIQFKWEYLGGYDMHFALDNVSVKTTTGVDELDDSSIVIYPNPANDEINVSYENKIKNVMIIDITGKICHQMANGCEQIDVSSLSNGMYVVRVITELGTSSRKLVIKR